MIRFLTIRKTIFLRLMSPKPIFFNRQSFYAFALYFFFFHSTLFGQEKFRTSQRINLHLGLGFGINTLSNNQAGDKDAAALTGIFRLGADYGISPMFTVGLAIFNSGFVTNKDSSEKAGIGGFGIYSNLNFYRSEKSTIFWHLGFGGSGFEYTNFRNNGKLNASGGFIQTGLGLRHYFGANFGFFVDLNLSGYNFEKFTFSDKEIYKTPSGNNFELGITGLELKFGLVVALGKNQK